MSTIRTLQRFLALPLLLAASAGAVQAQVTVTGTATAGYGVRFVRAFPPVQAGTKFKYSYTVAGFDPQGNAGADSFTMNFGAAAGAQLAVATYAGPHPNNSVAAVNAAGDLTVTLNGGKTLPDPFTFTIETPYVADPPGPSVPPAQTLDVSALGASLGKAKRIGIAVIALANPKPRRGDMVITFQPGSFDPGATIDVLQNGVGALLGTGVAENDGSAVIPLSRALNGHYILVGERTSSTSEFAEGEILGRMRVAIRTRE